MKFPKTEISKKVSKGKQFFKKSVGETKWRGERKCKNRRENGIFSFLFSISYHGN